MIVSEAGVTTLMAGLGVIVLFTLVPSFLAWFKKKEDQNPAQEKSLFRLKVRYLSVFWFASLADWLQVR